MFDGRSVAAVALAALVVLAGCGSAVPGTDGGGTGTVTVYVSDQQNAIDQFEHLNVTVSEVVFVRENDSGEGERVAVDANDTTPDLTELQGANASQVGSAEVPNGTYTQVVLNVTAVDGTLTDGSSADVKLPSERLRLNENVTVGDGDEIDFVFDVSVVQRGNQGYILKPVAGESGTGQEVDIEAVGDRATVESGTSDTTDDSNSDTDGNSDNDAAVSSSSRMSFYVSDQQNAIGQFESLNATVTEIGLHRAGDNETNGTWIRRDANATVDLTELQGARATMIDEFDVENGTYTQVYVRVSSVDGTLTDGTSVDVKLPSQRLRVIKNFEVRSGENVSFVYDITVFERGPNGYIVRPVVGETGTGDQVEIDPVDDEDSDDAANDAEGDLEAEFEADPVAGENATLVVTDDGPVENATVEVTRNKTTTTYTTDANGAVAVPIDDNATTLSVLVSDGETSVDLRVDLAANEDGETSGGGDANDAGNGGDGNAPQSMGAAFAPA